MRSDEPYEPDPSELMRNKLTSATVATANAITLTLVAGCASSLVVYQPPVTGPVATITFANTSETQQASLVTFDDAATCTGPQSIHFETERTVPPGVSLSTTISANREFAILTTLNTTETENYAIELGVTGDGPAPVLSRGFSAIGCNALLSFPAEPDKDYYVVVSGPVTAGICSVTVSEIFPEGMLRPVEVNQRIGRDPWGEPRSYCEPRRIEQSD